MDNDGQPLAGSQAPFSRVIYPQVRPRVDGALLITEILEGLGISNLEAQDQWLMMVEVDNDSQ